MNPITTLALCAVLGLGGVAWWQSSKVGDLEAENAAQARANAALTAQANQARLSATVAAAQRDRETKRAAEANAKIEAIITADLGECADETIDPDLADILNGLRSGD